jgi:hypothetical protein
MRLRALVRPGPGIGLAAALPLLLAAGEPPGVRPERPGGGSAPAVRLAELLRRGELVLVRVQPDTAFPGCRHLRYDQYLSGRRVFGAQLVERLDPEGRTLSVFGRVADGEAAPSALPGLTADQAARAALAEFPAGAVVLGEPEPVLLSR